MSAHCLRRKKQQSTPTPERDYDGSRREKRAAQQTADASVFYVHVAALKCTCQKQWETPPT